MKVKHAVIVGGGLIGIELAEMLKTRGIEVSLLIREDRFWGNVLPEEEAGFISKHIKKHGVQLLLNDELEEILGDAEGRVQSIRTKSGKEIACQLVGLTAGVSPNVSFLKDTELEVNRGVLVDAFLRTNFEYVYAAGDCVEFKKAPMGRRNIEQVWYTGKMMGEIAALNVLGNNKVYEPGPWFNSAKFFDIEYQTYGQVDSEPKAHQNVFFWENEAETKCLKIITDKAEGLFVGINAFGIRLRHELFDKWLREGRTTDFILGQWKNALFDPEFHKNDSKEILDEYNKAMNKSINLEMKNWKKIWS